MRKAVLKDFPTRVSFSASGANDAGTITSNGRVIKSNSSSGAYVIVTCSGTAYGHRPRQ